ncbi:MAG: site-specific integrase [Planctomycetota bacterium]
MGRIYQRGRVWYIDYTVDGKRARKRVGTVKADAQAALRELESQAARGEYGVVDNEMAFDNLAEKFMRFHKSEVRESTYERSVGLLANVRSKFGGRKVSEISLDDVDAYCDQRLTGDGVRRRTVNLEIGFLKQMLKYGVERRLVGSSPIEALKPKRETDKRASRALEPEEVQLLLGHATEAMRPVWLTFLMTGMRKGELVNLRWSDVDLDQGVIHIRCRAAWKTKNGQDRDIDISAAPDLWVELRRLRLASKRNAEYVFVTEQGTQRCHNLVRQLRGTARRAGIKDPKTLTVHGLRHTVATEMARQGTHPSIAQGVLGHKDPTVTLRYYTHMNNEDRRMAVGRLTYGKTPKTEWHKSGTKSEGLSQEAVG